MEDSTNNVAYLYIDGALVAQNRDFQRRARDLGINGNDWLGRSQYGDPLFAGLIDEFRIYNGTIDPVQVGLDFVTGPNNVVTNPGALSLVNVILNRPMVAGNRQTPCKSHLRQRGKRARYFGGDKLAKQQSGCCAGYKYGRVTATGPGSANISATFRGVTGTAAVIRNCRVGARPDASLQFHRAM